MMVVTTDATFAAAVLIGVLGPGLFGNVKVTLVEGREKVKVDGSESGGETTVAG